MATTKGRKLTEEHKRKIGLSKLGKKRKPFSPEWIEKLRNKVVSDETRAKISRATSGKNNPMYGRKRVYSQETLEKMSRSATGRKFSAEHRRKLSEAEMSERNNQWKGDDVGVGPLHRWIKKRFPKPELCQMCNKTHPNELSNISGRYLRNILDWQWLCYSCHRHYDFSTLRGLIKYANSLVQPITHFSQSHVVENGVPRITVLARHP